MSGRAFLGLGSNIGDRLHNLTEAKQKLQLPILKASSIYETEPVDYLDQAWFLNCVIEVPALDPKALLDICQGVETEMGRVRDIPKGPRVIDIDVLLCGDLIVNAPRLVVPHPRLDQRRFVLEPLTEIASEVVHPVLRQTMGDLLRDCPDRSVVRKMS